MLFVIFSLLTDYQVDVEVHTPNGRVDIVLLTHTDLFLLEINVGQECEVCNAANQPEELSQTICTKRQANNQGRHQLRQ